MSMLSTSSFLSIGMDIKSDCTKKQKCSERIRLCDYSGGSGRTSRGGHIWVVMMMEGEFSLWKQWDKRTQLARASWEEAGDIGLPGRSGFVIRDSRRWDLDRLWGSTSESPAFYSSAFVTLLLPLGSKPTSYREGKVDKYGRQGKACIIRETGVAEESARVRSLALFERRWLRVAALWTITLNKPRYILW